ncbi:hypothetical protein KQX54_021043 [Cotesia glomerata]|uniref:Uncharacterized protein n=1 Tax=Cotesia glomerata TaxID=32391 RepID=A0AAV7J640_COTGL|nr:hypothetical protein KQX54_021043 [Cotesia glomerata]
MLSIKVNLSEKREKGVEEGKGTMTLKSRGDAGKRLLQKSSRNLKSKRRRMKDRKPEKVPGRVRQKVKKRGRS